MMRKCKKISIIIPVYYNEDNLRPLYIDIKEKLLVKIDYDYEVVMVNDGSQDNSWRVMEELAALDEHIKIIRLSRNFGSHAAMLCGLHYCTGDLAVIKCADLQEPTEMILEMVAEWEDGNNVVLAVRDGRDESRSKEFFADFYYWLVRRFALENMPEKGFDVYLVDRKVINVLTSLDETNSALTGQVLWSGFKTSKVYYHRLARQIGTSKWTLKKKIHLVLDTLFSFSSIPIKIVMAIGVTSVIVAAVWTALVLFFKLSGRIVVSGWTTLFIFNLLSFGIVMLTLGILGEYLWRTFDASRRRPPFIVEDTNIIDKKG